MPVLEDIDAIYAGSADVSLYVGGELVWPLNLSYVISDLEVVYSSGSIINAAGSNYATLRGTVTVYRGSRIVQILTGRILTPTRVSGSTYLTVDGDHIVAPDRGTTTGSQRSAYFTGSYMGAVSDQILVSQQANSRLADTINYTIIPAFDYSGNLPAVAGVYSITYESWRQVVLRYTSGDYPQAVEAQASTVSGENCTIEEGVTTVQGHGAFTISVAKNGTSERTVIVTLRAGSAASGTASKTQERTIPVYATITPTVSPAGVLTVRMHITSGTPIGQTVASDIALHYTPTGGSEQVLITQSSVVLNNDRVSIIDGITVPAGTGTCYVMMELSNISDPTWVTVNYNVEGGGPGISE